MKRRRRIPRWKQRVRIFTEEPGRAIRNKNLNEPRFFPVWLSHVEQTIIRQPQSGLPLARTAYRMARYLRRFGKKRVDFEARALALIGTAYRTCGEYSKAERMLQYALSHAEKFSPNTLHEIYWRRAFLRRDQRRFTEALADADRSLDLAPDSGAIHPREFRTKGYIWFEMGKYEEAAQRFGECLESWDRLGVSRDEENIYKLVLLNHTISLTYAGHLEQATALLPKVKKLFSAELKSVAPPSLVQGKIVWLDGMFEYLKGHDARAETLLDRAREIFLALGLPHEAAAVTADVSRTLLSAGELEVTRQKNRTGISERIIVLKRFELSPRIDAAAEAVILAILEERDDVEIYAAIRKLRAIAGAGAGVLPGLIF